MRTFKSRLLSRSSLAALLAAVMMSVGGGSAAMAAGKAKVEVQDKTFDTAGAMLAYTEFELSGEPLAEGMGLDLDVLDPNAVDQPTPFDFVTGIESYEYSEEAMYAVNFQSKMGPHLVNGPVNATRGGSMESLGKRVVELAGSVNFAVEELPLNFYPLSFPYAKGSPVFAGPVNASAVGKSEVEVTGKDGNKQKVATVIPAYFRDFASLGWDEKAMDKAFVPAAAGAQMLKDVMWAQDFLGGMHTRDKDEEVEATSAKMDQDGKHALGVSAADGMNGVLLTEITWDKLRTLRDQFVYDGKHLGAKLTPAYDPHKEPLWFPARVDVSEVEKNGAKALGELKVTDGSSTLRNTWMLLWPLSETYAYTDQRPAHKAQKAAFLAVFDGAPFPSAPAANLNLDSKDDVVADDPFSLVSLLSSAVFKNIDALHFDSKAGTFVDHWADGKAGNSVTTYDAAYTIVALQIFQRSQDALPVGYASGDAAESLKTARGARALELIRKQADFILAHLVRADGLVADSIETGKAPAATASLDTQFAALRGLTAAFKATEDEKYRQAARKIYLAVEKTMFDPAIGTWAQKPGEPTVHTPWTEAAISGGLRDLLQTLRNGEKEKEPQLDLASLTSRYESWFRTVINGGMQQSEWVGDTGENIVEGDTSGDSDHDGVPQVTKNGVAPVMAGKALVGTAK